MMEAAPRIEVQPDAGALATAVAGELLSRIADAQAAGGVPSVCLTGGTIADRMHHEIARLGPDSGVDWAAVDVWWGDERFVDRESPERNAGQARAAFLDALGVPDDRVHEMPAPDAAGSVDEGAEAYGAALRAAPQQEFLVTMLGIGPDGHVASLFPGFDQVHAEGICVGVTGSPKPPPERISLTMPALGRSAAVWFLASGEGKSGAVQRALAEDGSVDETPARGVSGARETIWFLDQDAAGLL